MGCGNCGSGASGKPNGCKGNGGCSTGGCNRLNVYNWLADLPLHDSAKPYPLIEVSFNKGSRKEFFRNSTSYILDKGDWLAVEGVSGFDVGQVSLTGELVKLQLKKYGVKEADVAKRVLHPATEEELETFNKQKDREAEVLIRSRAIAKTLNLEMKLCEVEIQADSKKGTFFYTADQRVDFRELIKLYASDFKMKVEMKQIGARQESGKVGGIGSCGRELCCSTWLTDFKSVNTTAARYQNLSINQTKLSGQCGRLKCCLNYELDTYMDALSVFPDAAESLETVNGNAYLQKKDIFKNLMWYSYPNNSKQYPLSISRVKEILAMNKQGQKADELHPVELEIKDKQTGSAKVDMGFVNDVGQITLRALEKNKKKKKSGGKDGKEKQAGGGGQQQGAKPQQQAKPQGGGKPQQNKQGGNKPRPEGGQPQGEKPQGEKPQQQSRGERPQGEKPQQQPRGDRPQGGNRPQQSKGQPREGQQPDQPGEGQPQGQPGGNRPPQNKGQQQGNNGNRKPRPEGDQRGGNKPRPEGGQQPAGDKPQGEQPQGDRQPQGNRQGGNKPRNNGGGQQGGNRPQQQNRPQQDGPREERPQQAPPPQGGGEAGS